jgi:hypothetical protein
MQINFQQFRIFNIYNYVMSIREEQFMSRTKIISSILLTTIFLITQIIVVGAAPSTQDTTPITGTVESITLETDAETETTTVVVVVSDSEGGTQTVRLSLEDATALGLVSDDESGPVVDDSKIGTTVEIDPAAIIPDETPTEDAQHPVGFSLSNFFSNLLGVNYETVMTYHEDGNGFGVIAQALWMTKALEGDSDTFAAIMEAKKTKDFSGIELPDGSTPTSWGQFRKAVMSDREKSKENLGAIMSGRADDQTDIGDTELMNNNGLGTQNNQPKNNNGKNEGKGNGKEKNKDKGNGKNK